jgi:hypothetical protein
MEAMSPTLSGPDSLGFLLLGFVKRIICSVHIQNIQHLKQRIVDAAAWAAADVLGRVWQQTEYRSDICRPSNGAHIELQ